MKKIIAALFVLSLAIVPSAFALTCEQSQAFGGSDACWTEVQFSPSQTVGVSAGTVLVYDYASGQLNRPDGSLTAAGAWLVIPASVSADNTRIAGVLQTSVDATKISRPVNVLVRGYGDIFVTGLIASGDPLYVAAESAASTKGCVSASPLTAGYRNIATALEASSANGKKKAYIRVV